MLRATAARKIGEERCWGSTTSSVGEPLNLVAAEVGSIATANMYREFHKAAVCGRVDRLREMVGNGVNPNLPVGGPQADEGCATTALHFAAAVGDVAVVRALVDMGANPQARDEKKNTPLHWAAGRGQAKTIRALVELGADPRARAVDRCTPLHWAAYGRSAEGASVELVYQPVHDDDASASAWLAPGCCELVTAVRTLIELGGDQNAQAIDGSTPLHAAVRAGRVEVIQTLIALGADVQAQTIDKFTSLHLAAVRGGSVEVVNTLLELGADTGAHDSDGKTPLHVAAGNGHFKTARALVEGGADPNLRTEHGHTAMHYAARFGNPQAIRVLAKLGCDVHTPSTVGGTPLRNAASKGRTGAVRVLLELGADAAARDFEGRTPLHAAASRGHLKTAHALVKALAETGIDPNMRYDNDLSPLQVADLHGHTQIVKLLRRFRRTQTVPDVLDADGGILGEFCTTHTAAHCARCDDTCVLHPTAHDIRHDGEKRASSGLDSSPAETPRDEARSDSLSGESSSTQAPPQQTERSPCTSEDCREWWERGERQQQDLWDREQQARWERATALAGGTLCGDPAVAR